MENKNICWGFPIDEAESITGLNNPGIETFKDRPLLFLAKEICQNSLDAKANNKKPVIVEFNQFFIPKKEIPGLSYFSSMINKQIDYWSNLRYDKTNVVFFKEAKKIINENNIICLRISDFNTTGLSNSRDDFSGWKKLVKSEGVSDNQSTAGGSFGIGKFAPFACSYLYTVFYSTKDLKGREAYQGVARLSSFKTDDGKITSGTGYYGSKIRYSFVPEMIHFEKDFKRKEAGTDIFIIGFQRVDSDWEDQIFASVIDTFMISLHKGELIFKLNGKTLDKDTLPNFIKKYRDEKYGELLNEGTLDYYDVLVEKYAIYKFYKTFFDKDDIELILSMHPTMKNHVAIIRNNGMKIFDQGRLPRMGDYSGLLLLKGKKINEYFRLLENPQHDGWSEDRAMNKLEAKRKIKEVKRFIIDSVQSLLGENRPDTFDAEGVGEYLPDEENDIGNKDLEEDLSDEIKEIELQVKDLQKKKRIRLPAGDGGPGGNGRKGNGNGTHGPGENNNKNSEKIIEIINKRVFINQDKKYSLKFSAPEAIPSLKICINIAGETANEQVEILNAEQMTANLIEREKLEHKKNVIYIKDIEPFEQINIVFEIKEKGIWALEVEFYAD